MEQIYPRTVILEDNKLLRLLKEKGELVLTGREASIEIEEKEKEMQSIDQEIQSAEKTVDISDLLESAKGITDEFNAVVAKMEESKKLMFDRIKAAVPPELYDKYESKKKEKEDLELERNKIGLKISQKNDKIIPLSQKLMKPHLKYEADDFDTLRLENGQIVATIFNHFNDYMTKYRSKNKINGS